MIKKNIIITILVISLVFLSTTSGIRATDEQTATAEPTIELDDSIQNLKDKIAQKVEELTKNNKKIIAGYITKKEKEILQLKKIDITDTTDIKVIIDESVTQFYSLISGSKKTAQINEFSQGDFIIVSGPFIDNTINANAVYKTQDYEVKSGKITDVDKKDFTITVLTTEKDVYTLDVEQFTKQLQMDTRTLTLNPVGFSKLKSGDIIHFAIKKITNQKDMRASAIRIVIVPQSYFETIKPSKTQ